MVITAVFMVMAASGSAKWKDKSKKKGKSEPAPPAASNNSAYIAKPAATCNFTADQVTPENPAANARVRQLIAIIEANPSGVVVNNAGVVNAPPDNQPYNPDGTRNQNFRVDPDLSQAGVALILNADHRRAQAVQELIRMGKPAVPEMSRALVWESHEYRRFYAYILGELKDERSVPAVLKYLEDAQMKATMIPITRTTGDMAMVKKLLDDGNRMGTDSAQALNKITGQNFGVDLLKWQAWWETNKCRVGPTPKIITYTANPPSPKVHYTMPPPTRPHNPNPFTP